MTTATAGGCLYPARNFLASMAAAAWSRSAARSFPSRSVRRSTWRALIEHSASRPSDSAAAWNDRALPPAYSIFFSRPGL